ncbi:programmed cell death protein 7-like isoform X2 [Rhinoderma darwinii]|uniref:programmed cell death protein 7-like isoform X2 n=1 Tax=Rhinoderma darwinii TaxID=43563 RepID=UPI003F67DA63
MSLEKLRKLRKEAAGRKGVCPPLSAEETFTNHIIRLRSMVHKRSALYDAEEKTLRVILEGEQEEERQREKDKRLKKEKEKTLQKQRELDSILFGDTDFNPISAPVCRISQVHNRACSGEAHAPADHDTESASNDKIIGKHLKKPGTL